MKKTTKKTKADHSHEAYTAKEFKDTVASAERILMPKDGKPQCGIVLVCEKQSDGFLTQGARRNFSVSMLVQVMAQLADMSIEDLAMAMLMHSSMEKSTSKGKKKTAKKAVKKTTKKVVAKKK